MNNDRGFSMPGTEEEVATGSGNETAQFSNTRRVASIRGAASGRGTSFCNIFEKDVLENLGDDSIVVVDGGQAIIQDLNLSDKMDFVFAIKQIENIIYWTPLIFENTEKPVLDVPRDTRDHGQNPVSDFYSTVDSLNGQMIDALGEYLSTSLINPKGNELVYANAIVIPQEAEITRSLVETVLFGTEDSAMLLSGTSQPYSAQMLISQRSRLRMTVGISKKNDAINSIGMPVRSDFQIDVEETYFNRVASNLQAASGGAKLVGLTGFVNARYIGQHSLDKDPNEYYFTPEVIVTGIDTIQQGVTDGNFGRMIMAMAGLPQLYHGQMWRQAFTKTMSSKEDTTSMAGLAHAMIWKDGKIPADIKKVDKDNRATQAWIDSIFMPEPDGNFSVDYALSIREGSPDYTSYKLLLDVAYGDENAIKRLVGELDALTNGNFSKFYGHDLKASDFFEEIITVPYGHFEDKNGIRDSNEIDMRFVCNRLRNNYNDMLMDYVDGTTMISRNYDLSESLTRLVNVYQQVTDGEFVMKGFEHRLYLNAKFLEATYEALFVMSGLPVDTEVLGMLQSTQDRRTISRRRRGLNRDLTVSGPSAHQGFRGRSDHSGW